MDDTTNAFITPELSKQINSFIDSLQSFNKLLPQHARRLDTDYKFLRKFCVKVISERNKRAKEIGTKEYNDVVELARSQLPMDTYNIFCMDGRVLSPIVFGQTYKITGSIRVPGGILQEFDWGRDGKMFLRENSAFANLLYSAFERSDTIAQVFDSHVGCAARMAEEEARGYHPKDSGLLKDVLHKKEMAKVTTKYIKEKYNGKKKIFSIKTSFDPSNGFMYMGLGATATLDYVTKEAEKAGKTPEYTKEIILKLVSLGMVISTEELSKEPTIHKLLSKYGNFQIDWEREYVATTESFWKAIVSMKNEAIPVIVEKLKNVYPRLKSDDPDSRMELSERAIIVLLNTLSGFMLKKDDLKTGKKHIVDPSYRKGYLYGEHREEFVQVYEGGQPPYETSDFVLLSLEEKSLPEDIELASVLVRANRHAGRIIDNTGTYRDPESFEKAVVLILVHEIVREDVSEKEWHILSKIDWSDLSSEWDNMENSEFRSYLLKKGIESYPMIEHINTLRLRMASLFDPVVSSAHHLTQQSKVAVPTILSRDRTNRFLIPFVKLGY